MIVSTASEPALLGGPTVREAFENMAVCMFDYITDIETVDVDESMTLSISVEGHDLHSLLYNYMDEVLFNFCADPYLVCRYVHIDSIDTTAFKITATLYVNHFVF